MKKAEKCVNKSENLSSNELKFQFLLRKNQRHLRRSNYHVNYGFEMIQFEKFFFEKCIFKFQRVLPSSYSVCPNLLLRPLQRPIQEWHFSPKSCSYEMFSPRSENSLPSLYFRIHESNLLFIKSLFVRSGCSRGFDGSHLRTWNDLSWILHTL